MRDHIQQVGLLAACLWCDELLSVIILAADALPTTPQSAIPTACQQQQHTRLCRYELHVFVMAHTTCVLSCWKKEKLLLCL